MAFQCLGIPKNSKHLKMLQTVWSNNRTEILLKELWQNATFFKDIYTKLEGFTSGEQLEEDKNIIFSNLASVRNRNLITEKEQKILNNTVVAFFGLSVGSHAAITWVMESRANKVKIADPDRVSATNLNRLRTSYKSIGKYKTDILKTEMLGINPTCVVTSLRKTTPQNMIKLCENSKTHIIIDSVDDLKSKLILRKVARRKKIPLIMATDVGDNVIIDIERHDMMETSFFNGRAKQIENIDFDKLSLRGRLELIHQIVGFKEHSSRMLLSLTQIGEELPTWPQLGATAAIAGGLITTTIKKIILGEVIPSGRYFLSTDQIFNGKYFTGEEEVRRKKLIKKITDFK